MNQKKTIRYPCTSVKNNMSEKRAEKAEAMEMESIAVEGKSKRDDEEETIMLPGFRFHPTDEELVGFYLRHKVKNKKIKIDLIKQVDIYKHDPWDLPKVMGTVGDNKELYFFSMRGRKYKNSVRPNRVTGSGFWKATGIDKPVYSTTTTTSSDQRECIGLKKSLVYYRGNAGKGTKTDWMMHEFRLPPTTSNAHLPNPNNIAPEAEVWTLCRIFKRISNYKRFTPDWKKQQQPIVKQSFGDASSKACSLQSEISDDHSNNSNFIKMAFPHKNNMHAASGGNLNYQVDQRNSYYNNSQPITMPQSSFTSSNSGFWNTNAENQEYLFSDGNWDELKSVVDLAIDPRTLFGFR